MLHPPSFLRLHTAMGKMENATYQSSQWEKENKSINIKNVGKPEALRNKYGSQDINGFALGNWKQFKTVYVSM